MGESSSSRIPRLPYSRFSVFAHALCPATCPRAAGSGVATPVDGIPKGEPKSPFGRSRCRNTGPGFQGAAMRPLVWVVRGTKALDSQLRQPTQLCCFGPMGVQGESEVSSGRGETPKSFPQSGVSHTTRRTEPNPLVKIAIKRF